MRAAAAAHALRLLFDTHLAKENDLILPAVAADPTVSLLLVAPHDPVPLLRQLSTHTGGAMTVSYEQRGPDAWRLRLTRT